MTLDTDRIYTKEDIITQLSDMNAPKGTIVLMHSSLRLIGKVEGGAKTILDAMIEYFTAESNRLVTLGGTIYSFSK